MFVFASFFIFAGCRQATRGHLDLDNVSRRAHLSFHVRQLTRLLGRLAEEIGSHLQHGGRLGVDRTSLHFLHPRAYVLLDDVFQLQRKPEDSVDTDMDIRLKERIRKILCKISSGESCTFRSCVVKEEQGLFQQNVLAFRCSFFYPLGHYPFTHLLAYIRHMATAGQVFRRL